MSPTLYMFCGLPGSGKTTLSRALAQHLGALHLRIDAIESGLKASLLHLDDLKDSGYRAAQALARENLELGNSVIADAVFWLEFLRPPWQTIADETGATLRWIEITCAEPTRQRRVEARAAATGRKGWKDIGGLEMDPVAPPKVTIETTDLSEAEALAQVLAALDVPQTEHPHLR